MATLDEIVSLSITSNSVTPSRAGFGIPLFLDYHAVFAEKYRSYTDLAGMVSDGFASTSPQYRAARAFFAQNPAPERVVIGRLPAAPSNSWTVTVTDAVEGHIVKATVVSPDGTETVCSHTVGAAETTTTVATALEVLIEAASGVDSVAAAAVITVTPTTAGQRFWLHSEQGCEIKETTADAGYDDELTALQVENDDWYFVTIGSQSEANIDLVAAWASTQKKLFLADTAATDELTGVGVLGFGLKAAAYTNTAVLYAPKAHEYAAAAWIGVCGPQSPGSLTWAFKTLTGVTPRTLTSTQRLALETDNENHYQTVAGINITRKGVVASGEFLDITHGLHALEADIKESVFGLLANSPKVPYTQKGMDSIANAIRGALQRFEGTELLVDGLSTVTVPEVSDQSLANRAARHVANVKFAATLAGAVHTVQILGTVTV